MELKGCNSKVWTLELHEPSIVCPFRIATLVSQNKREKLFWECTFPLLNLKGKINVEEQHIYCFSHIGDSIILLDNAFGLGTRVWLEGISGFSIKTLLIVVDLSKAIHNWGLQLNFL